MKLLFATLLIVFVSVQAETHHRYEEPKYNLTKNQPKDKSFEIRKYDPSTWTLTNYTEGKWEQEKAFMRLFHYIQGENKQSTKIPMTVPVLISFSQSECFLCQDVFFMSFYLPKKYQNKPPVPTAPDVSIVRHTATVMYTRSFPGYANPSTFKWHAKKLYNDLKHNGITDSMIKNKMFMGASYDSPMHVHRRHNEVWIEGVSEKLEFY